LFETDHCGLAATGEGLGGGGEHDQLLGAGYQTLAGLGQTLGPYHGGVDVERLSGADDGGQAGYRPLG